MKPLFGFGLIGLLFMLGCAPAFPIAEGEGEGEGDVGEGEGEGGTQPVAFWWIDAAGTEVAPVSNDDFARVEDAEGVFWAIDLETGTVGPTVVNSFGKSVNRFYSGEDCGGREFIAPIPPRESVMVNSGLRVRPDSFRSAGFSLVTVFADEFANYCSLLLPEFTPETVIDTTELLPVSLPGFVFSPPLHQELR